MNLRRRSLPPGWYPESSLEITELLEAWKGEATPPPRPARAAIAPHAGWTFSGRLAYRAVAALGQADTVAVIGGHLPARYPVLCAHEGRYETPLGPLEGDAELAATLAGLLSMEEDRVADNTVEIQLPLVKALFPTARLLWLRAPAGPAAIELGEALAKAAATLGRRLACLGSTDLTHYGPDYGFEPAGKGQAAEEWVRKHSDRGFIDAALAMDPKAVLERGAEGSACSAGAAAAALAFAHALGADKAELLGYATSLEIRKAPSFVGYCAVGFFE